MPSRNRGCFPTTVDPPIVGSDLRFDREKVEILLKTWDRMGGFLCLPGKKKRLGLWIHHLETRGSCGSKVELCHRPPQHVGIFSAAVNLHMDCENLKSEDFNSYGTFIGLRYRKGTGAIRLMYCTIIALTLSLFRIIADLALGFALAHHSSWSFLIASLVDLLLAVTASAAACFAVKERRYGLIVSW